MTSNQASLARMGRPAIVRRRLFCLPFAGGGASTFRHWPATLPDDIELLVVQLPGRDARRAERPLDSIAAMARATQLAVREASDLPFAVFGHSMGALVAYELARALEDEGGPRPAHVFVSARRPPDVPDRHAPIHALPDDQFLDALQHRYGAVPQAVRDEPDLLALLLPVLRADIKAVETYPTEGGRKVTCPLHVYGGADDRRPAPDELAGWDRAAAGDVRVRLFPGDHFYLTSAAADLTGDMAMTWAGVSAASR